MKPLDNRLAHATASEKICAPMSGTGLDPPRVPAPNLSRMGIMIQAIERPMCKCGIRTMLARIAPDGEGYELRTFECPKCNQIVLERVAADPIATANGWVS